MTKAFNAYEQAVADFGQKARSISQAINDNRLAHAGLIAELENRFLKNEDTKEIEGKLAESEAAHQILQYKAGALDKASKVRGSDGAVKEAAQRVITENTKAMKALQAEWDQALKSLQEIQVAYFQKLIAMGEIYKRGQNLQEEVTIVSASAGSNTYLPRPGDDINIHQNKGPIFMDARELAMAFANGTLPINKNFAGVVTGTPRPKVLTAGAEPAPPRQLRRPEKPVKPKQEGA